MGVRSCEDHSGWTRILKLHSPEDGYTEGPHVLHLEIPVGACRHPGRRIFFRDDGIDGHYGPKVTCCISTRDLVIWGGLADWGS